MTRDERKMITRLNALDRRVREIEARLWNISADELLNIEHNMNNGRITKHKKRTTHEKSHITTRNHAG